MRAGGKASITIVGGKNKNHGRSRRTGHQPQKRVFLALVLVSAIVTAIILYLIWKVTFLGLASIVAWLPAAFGIFVAGVILFLFLGELAIVLAILGMPLPKILYFWAWKAINFLFPFAVGLGRIFSVPRSKVEQSFVAVNNALVKQHHVRVPSNRLLILTPHCLQLDTCPRKITRNVENCAQCGGCSVGSLLKLCHQYGMHLVVATGGTLARQLVAKARPKAIIAVACERDLTSGIQDVFPIPVIAIFNQRPFGPCFNTRVDIARVEEAIRLLGEGTPQHGSQQS